MAKKPPTYDSLTAALLDAIADSGLSFKELERRSGVVRQSLMKFARGERALRLDMADKLAKCFELEIVRPTRKAK